MALSSQLSKVKTDWVTLRVSGNGRKGFSTRPMEVFVRPICSDAWACDYVCTIWLDHPTAIRTYAYLGEEGGHAHQVFVENVAQFTRAELQASRSAPPGAT
jgi:hypothetical protein